MDMSVGEGIKALGEGCFKSLSHVRELQSDGSLGDYGWVVQFIMLGVVINTEPLPTAAEALLVAYKAKQELESVQ